MSDEQDSPRRTSIARLEAEQGYDESDEEAQPVNVGKSRDARREEEEDDEDEDEEDEDGMSFPRVV
jgi:hypothetical protein